MLTKEELIRLAKLSVLGAVMIALGFGAMFLDGFHVVYLSEIAEDIFGSSLMLGLLLESACLVVILDDMKKG